MFNNCSVSKKILFPIACPTIGVIAVLLDLCLGAPLLQATNDASYRWCCKISLSLCFVGGGQILGQAHTISRGVDDNLLFL